MTNPSPITRPSTLGILANHERRLQGSERQNDTPWIFVGDPDADQPWAPPFTNGANIPGQAPLSFLMTIDGWLKLRGGFTIDPTPGGVVPGDEVFALPDGSTFPFINFIPKFNHPLLLPLSDGSGAASVLVNTLGSVIYTQTI